MPAKKPHERVMEFVEKELSANPGLGSRELFEKAKKVSRSISNLSVRQFHAKYPLVVKRRMAAASSDKKPKRRAKTQRKSTRKAQPRRRTAATRSSSGRTPDRDAIREVLMGFAADLSAAESQTDTIKVVSGLDKYIDRIVAAG